MTFSPWPRNIVLRAVAGAWSAGAGIPLGFVVLLGLLVRAGRVLRSYPGNGAYHLHVAGWIPDMFLRRKRTAFTAGWIVLWFHDRTEKDPKMRSVRELLHELRHVWQGYTWGIFLIPAYLLCLLVRGYRNNPFEIDARKAAERWLTSQLESLGSGP